MILSSNDNNIFTKYDKDTPVWNFSVDYQHNITSALKYCMFRYITDSLNLGNELIYTLLYCLNKMHPWRFIN